MTTQLSEDTRVVLLLTAPLIVEGVEESSDLLTPSEYRRLKKVLTELGMQVGALLDQDGDSLPDEVKRSIDVERFKRLMNRRLEVDQALDHWQLLPLWVLSDHDEDYPRRIKERLRDLAPPIIYGCGDLSLLSKGGLAIVGSREVDPVLIEYTDRVAQLAAAAGKNIVSGGARGIDQAAMRGALVAGGKSVGVLADSLERIASNRDQRKQLSEGSLVLLSPYDPAASFNIGHAMQRNKVIYSLADAALVVNSDLEKGGTWSGAVEQLEKFRVVPVYVRSDGPPSEGLTALRQKGALSWPNPSTTEALIELLDQHRETPQPSDQQLSFL
jgi:DNA processing protein